MTRSVAVSIQNNFKGGLVSEATALNFPENSCTDTENCVFGVTGLASRRPGFDFEFDYALHTVDRQGAAMTSFLWQDVAGNGDLIFTVQQIGSTLYFFTASQGSAVSQASPLTVDISAFSPSGAPSPSATECQFAIGNGNLFVTHPFLETFVIKYDTTGGTLSTTQVSLQIRDFTGEEDSLATDARPATLSDEHKYNLYNQGWSDGTQITAWDGARADFPSNADVWWLFKNTSNAFDTTQVANVDRGNTPAPKGHYLLNPYNEDRATASGISGLAVISTGTNRVSTVAFHAGRAFYSGLNYQGKNGKIYFTQILEQDKQFGYCYQQNDPTSETDSDLLPSDGGVINIPDAGQIIKLYSSQSALIVFATNGVWAILGSQGIGFAANDYTIQKISTVPCVSASSFVDVSGQITFWNFDGIYGVQTNQASTSGLGIQSLTNSKIKTFISNIPAESKRFVRGYFDSLSGTIQWLYRSTAPVNILQSYEFDRVLNLNTLTGAFYPWSLGDNSVKLNGVVVVYGVGGSVAVSNIIDGSSNPVVDGSGNQLISTVLSLFSTSPTFKYCVSYPDGISYKMTFAETNNFNYKDWSIQDEVDYESSFVTGFQVHGDMQRRFQANYLYVFCDNTRLSQLYLQPVWDYALNGNTGRWGSKQKLIFSDSNYSNSFKRLKVRGQGISLQFRVQSVSGQPFDIVGWSGFETGNSAP